MVGFLKENVIFVISSMIFLGLFVAVSELKKAPDLQANTVETTSTINPTAQTADVKKDSNTQVSNPTVTPTVKAPTPQRLPNRDDREEEIEDD